MSETKKAINSLDMEKVSAILLDVAGTTTAISFVKETLYPYIIKNAEEFLKSSWENDDVKKAIAQFEEKDLDASKSAEVVKNLTEKDDSNVGLKTIQGLLLQKGYESGELKGHVFADVLKFLESWSSTKKIAIFSSGSVESQQLLFKNSTEGDLSSHIKKFFDLSVGSKTESETYKKIAKELEVSPVDVLFLTDDVKEAEAAKSAEFNAVLVEREGNAPISEETQANFAVVKSFADISVEKVKRKIVEDSVEEPPKKLAKIETEAAGESNDEKKIEENKTTEQKNDTDNGVEAMEVDEVPVVAEKVAEEKVSTEAEKHPKSEETPQEEKKEETVEPTKPEVTEEKPESMEVDSKETESKKEETDKPAEQKEGSEEQTNKAETETGTQTKSAVMNECETQTTISIAAVDELPMKEVQEKLMSTETKEAGTEEKVEKTEVKETEEKKENTETETKTDVKEDAVEKKEESKEVSAESKETVESEKESEKMEEVKENNKDDVTEAKEDVKEVEDAKELKEDVKEVKEDVKEVKEDVKEVKEDTKEVKEDVKEVEEDVEEVKENGNVCDKNEVATNGEKEDVVEAKEDKETTDEKKECLESNGAQETHANGVTNGTVEKENKSQLANGKDSVVPNGETSETTNGTLEKNEDEIKVKKIGDNVESAPVSVEA